jgi:hypothetical protein
MRFIVCVLCAIILTQSVSAAEPWQTSRSALVEEIREDVRRTRIYTGRAELDERVLAAMGYLIVAGLGRTMSAPGQNSL